MREKIICNNKAISKSLFVLKEWSHFYFLMEVVSMRFGEFRLSIFSPTMYLKWVAE